MPDKKKTNKPKELTAGGSGSRLRRTGDGALRRYLDEGDLTAPRDTHYYMAGLINALASQRMKTPGTPDNKQARQAESRRAAGGVPRDGASKPKATPRRTRIAK